MKEKETKNEYEYKDLRICKRWIQIASCRKCLFEVLCHYLDDNERRTNWTIWTTWGSKKSDW